MALSPNFHQANGFVRLANILLGVIAIGLTASRFRPHELNEFIFLATLIFCSSLSSLHFFLSFLTSWIQGGKCFKILDFIFHMIGGVLLFVASVLMFMSAPQRGKVLDYRFQDTKQVVIRTTAAIAGLENALIYFALAYLTLTEKRLIYFATVMKRTIGQDHIESGQLPTDLANVGATAINSSTGNLSSGGGGKLFDRFTWRRLIVDDILEARILTILLGILSVGLLADCYEKEYEVEEYFFSMVIICFCLTFLSQVSYAFGIVNLSETVSSVIDILIQFFSSLNLLVGGTLMLGSVIQHANEHNSYAYNYKSIERTFVSMLGIFNGLLYGHIGMHGKRAHFEQNFDLRTDVTYAVEIDSSDNPTIITDKEGRRKNISIARLESLVDDPKNGGCTVA